MAWAAATWRFVGTLSQHPLQLAVLALVGLPLLNFGRALGLPLLFWHEEPRAQAEAGAATTVLAAYVAFVIWLLEVGRAPTVTPAIQDLLAGAAGLWLVLVGPAIAVRAWRHLRYGRATSAGDGAVGLAPGIRAVSDDRPGELRSVHIAPWAFLAGIALAVVAVAAVLLLIQSLRVWIGDGSGALVARLLRVPGGVDPWPHVFASAIAGAMAVGWILLARDATPAVALCLVLGLVMAGHGFLMFHVRNPTLIVLGGAVVLALAGLRKYRLRLAPLRAHYRSPVAYPPAARGPADQLLDYLGRNQGHTAREGAALPRPLVVVCASGGGTRAAVWTAAILGRLDELPGFRRAVRMVSGASGGMVGATYWVGSLHAAAAGQPGPTWRSLVATVERDSLTAVARRLVVRDLPRAFLPCANEDNRGQALEDAWHAAAPRWLDVRFGDLREGEIQGQWPSLVFTPMLVEDGRRLVISNLDLTPVVANEVRWLAADTASATASVSGYHYAELFPGMLAALPVRTAARLAAAFPYVSPAVVLPTRPRRRVVDAGYFDSYGLNLACSWLREVLNRERDWLRRHVSRILLVQIRDNVSGLSMPPGHEEAARAGAAASDAGPLAAPARGFEWLSTPLHGVFSARTSVAIFRNDTDLESVTRLYDEGMNDGYLQTTIFELKGEVSLSWYLTRNEVAWIESQAGSAALTGKLRDIAGWLG